MDLVYIRDLCQNLVRRKLRNIAFVRRVTAQAQIFSSYSYPLMQSQLLGPFRQSSEKHLECQSQLLGKAREVAIARMYQSLTRGRVSQASLSVGAKRNTPSCERLRMYFKHRMFKFYTKWRNFLSLPRCLCLKRLVHEEYLNEI